MSVCCQISAEVDVQRLSTVLYLAFLFRKGQALKFLVQLLDDPCSAAPTSCMLRMRASGSPWWLVMGVDLSP